MIRIRRRLKRGCAVRHSGRFGKDRLKITAKFLSGSPAGLVCPLSLPAKPLSGWPAGLVQPLSPPAKFIS
jgi:hypothetical protein